MQAGNRGIGMGYGQFVDTFESVCRKHLRDGKARAFAFVFYDMTHGVVRETLRQAHGFQRLHEKTGPYRRCRKWNCRKSSRLLLA